MKKDCAEKGVWGGGIGVFPDSRSKIFKKRREGEREGGGEIKPLIYEAHDCFKRLLEAPLST